MMFVAATAMTPVYSAPHLDAASWHAVTTPPAAWLALYAVLFATLLTYLLNTWALRHTHSSQVALYINVQPLVAAALAPAFGQAAPDWRFFVALVAVPPHDAVQFVRGRVDTPLRVRFESVRGRFHAFVPHAGGSVRVRCIRVAQQRSVDAVEPAAGQRAIVEARAVG